MNTDIIQTLTSTFEAHAQQTEGDVEYWLARDIQHLLGYAEWRNFNQSAVSKAKIACEVSGHQVFDHFVDANKMVDLGSGGKREIEDILLTRYACYLVAQNGDPRKEEIAFAQTYFAVQTRRAELIEQRLLEAERVQARQKLTTTEKELSSVIFEQTGGNQDFALIRSKGDHALFGKSTQAMKAQWKVPASRPLADFAPTIILKAKDFATEITIFSRATIGAIDINTVPSCTNQGFITCLPNAKVPLYFLHQWLKENVETFILHASGSTFKEISKGVFKGLDFLQPDAGLVQRYQQTVSSVADQLLNLQRRNRNLRSTRDLLLPKLIQDS